MATVVEIDDVVGVIGEETSVEELERLITQGAADLASAERDWMLAIAEFDRREAYLAWSAASCAAWLASYAGVDMRAARERVRVARAIAANARLSAAMASGELSYSKARAITRVATEESMQAWIDVAVAGTTNQLERLVAAVRRQGDDGLEEERRQQMSRSLDHRVASDGSMVITLRLPRADGASGPVHGARCGRQRASPVGAADRDRDAVAVRLAGRRCARRQRGRPAVDGPPQS